MRPPGSSYMDREEAVPRGTLQERVKEAQALVDRSPPHSMVFVDDDVLPFLRPAGRQANSAIVNEVPCITRRSKALGG